jgi:hypothetical protein
MTQDEIIASNLSEVEKANERIKMLEDKLASIKQAIAELESQEPLAWDLADKVRQDLDRQSCPDAFMRIAVESIVKHHPAQPAQRTWVGLTDEERDYIWEKNRTKLGGWDYGGDEVMYDRHFEDAVIAIEAKLKEKNT